MLKIVEPGILVFALVAAFVPLPALHAQKTPETSPAPVPAQILTAKKVFVSNAGVGANALPMFTKGDDPNGPYNQFYAALKTWGRYELVTAPVDADLVFEIDFTAPLIGTQTLDTYAPQLGLAILDTKTHFRLWTLTQPVERAIRKETWNKNLSKGLADLVDDLKKLAGQGAAGQPSK
jgi:hypothetical protein